MQTGFYALTVLLFVALVLLGWLNREAEAVQGPTLFVGVVAALATLLFGLKARHVEPVRFPVEYVFAKDTLMPLSCTWFPESTSYSTPDNGAEESGFVTERVMRALSSTARDEVTIRRIFANVLMSQIVDVISWTFFKGCDSDVMRIDLPGRRLIQFNSRPFLGDVKVNRAEVARLFPEDTAMREGLLDRMFVPAGTTLERVALEGSEGLRFRSAYSTVTIRVASQSAGFGQIGRLAELCRLPVDFDQQQIGTAVFVVTLEASFARLLAGSPTMKRHERWVSAMFESLSTFDSTKRWERVQANYHLYYSQKTKTVYQEMREALEEKMQSEEGKKGSDLTPRDVSR